MWGDRVLLAPATEGGGVSGAARVSFDVFAYCHPEPRDDGIPTYAVDPDIAYPALLRHMRQLRDDGGEAPASLRLGEGDSWLWNLIRDFNDNDLLLVSVRRFEVLTVVRHLFDLELSARVPGSKRIHILNRPAWRLSAPSGPDYS